MLVGPDSYGPRELQGVEFNRPLSSVRRTFRGRVGFTLADLFEQVAVVFSQ